MVSAINDVKVFKYISKPWINKELIDIVNEALILRRERKDQIINHLKVFKDIEKYKKTIKRFCAEIDQLNNQAKNGLLKVLQAKDVENYKHSERVSEYAMLIASNMGLNSKQIETLRRAALFHDIGKVAILYRRNSNESEANY